MQPASAVDQSNTLEVKGREPFFLAQHYLPGRGLDRPPLPRSAPDPDYLSDVMASGLPIRLRLYIGAAGAVEQIDVLQSNPDDADAIERIKAMFFATTFVAGQQAGVEVAAYIDIQVELANPLSAASTATLFTR